MSSRPNVAGTKGEFVAANDIDHCKRAVVVAQIRPPESRFQQFEKHWADQPRLFANFRIQSICDINPQGPKVCMIETDKRAEPSRKPDATAAGRGCDMFE
jgi:hypothetical protein